MPFVTEGPDVHHDVLDEPGHQIGRRLRAAERESGRPGLSTCQVSVRAGSANRASSQLPGHPALQGVRLERLAP